MEKVIASWRGRVVRSTVIRVPSPSSPEVMVMRSGVEVIQTAPWLVKVQPRVRARRPAISSGGRHEANRRVAGPAHLLQLVGVMFWARRDQIGLVGGVGAPAQRPDL